ncbi:MAG: HipA domain-containing protein [Treponema sp.]|jgi:hypothetical protein|nr:HipA domain-containing protein [Treponema sp.]
MKYYIHHKTRRVALIELDDETKKAVDIEKIFIPEEMPVRVDGKNRVLDCNKIDRWIDNRGIPNSRDSLDEKLKKLKVKTARDLSIMSYGLNLTDHYWISKKSENKQWERINFFDNDFNEDIGRVLFENGKIADAEILSPDCTLNGNLEKMWKIIDGKRMLVKGGNDNDRLEPFNEKLASLIMERLNIDHVAYELFIHNDKTYSICECMVDRNHEFINAHFVYNHKPDNKSLGKYADYIRTLEFNGIRNAKESVNKMICLDFLIANSDRHHGNFGIIRNADTLQWEKAAPVFDNGTSMWAGKHESFIRLDKTENRSFDNTNEEMIQNITNADWFRKEKLSGVGDAYYDLISRNPFVLPAKRLALRDAFERRLEVFNEFVTGLRGTSPAVS